ncbi:MAG: hypothetical protein H6727_07365 [Myxococcales bacterium]|nr:hypothetical protein [Myxococcales bacterium]
MSAQDRIPPPELLDAFLDGELSQLERQQFEAYLSEHEEVQEDLVFHRRIQQATRQSLQTQAEDVMASIDFDSFTQRIMQSVQEPVVSAAKEETPIAVPAEPAWTTQPREEIRPSLWETMVMWLRAHPMMSVAAGSFAAVMLVIATPLLMDPGPAPNDCVVDEAAGSKSAQVAVLQAQNKDGQQMTVIVVDGPEPGAEDKDREKDMPNNARKAPKKRGSRP